MKQVTALGKKLVQQNFKKQNILSLIKAKLCRIQHGQVQLWLPKTQIVLQHHGFIHGGVISTLADCASGLSCFSILDHQDHTCISVQFKINFLKPAHTDLTAIGKVLKQNKSLMVATAQVFNNDGKICAYMIQTIKRIKPEDLRKQ